MPQADTPPVIKPYAGQLQDQDEKGSVSMTSGDIDYQRTRWLTRLVRDEEAAGSNPATPTTKLHVAACFRNQFRLLGRLGGRPLGAYGRRLARLILLTSGNAPLFVRRVGAASTAAISDGMAPEER